MTDIERDPVTDKELHWLEKHGFLKDAWGGWFRKVGDVGICFYKRRAKWHCNGSENDTEVEAATPRLALKSFHDIHATIVKASRP